MIVKIIDDYSSIIKMLYTDCHSDLSLGTNYNKFVLSKYKRKPENNIHKVSEKMNI